MNDYTLQELLNSKIIKENEINKLGKIYKKI
jgi:hypothetical protein